MESSAFVGRIGEAVAAAWYGFHCDIKDACHSNRVPNHQECRSCNHSSTRKIVPGRSPCRNPHASARTPNAPSMDAAAVVRLRLGKGYGSLDAVGRPFPYRRSALCDDARKLRLRHMVVTDAVYLAVHDKDHRTHSVHPHLLGGSGCPGPNPSDRTGGSSRGSRNGAHTGRGRPASARTSQALSSRDCDAREDRVP